MTRPLKAVILVLGLVLPHAVFAQPHVSTARTQSAVRASMSPADVSYTVKATRAVHSITIDGVLDDEDWATAPLIDAFTQAEPRTGEPATERTEVRVLFDAHFLYIGAFLHDSSSSGIVVNDIRKDFKEDDQDDFELLLDTFHDRRNGYVFITNPAGARADRQVASEGREINMSWDGVWTVKTKRIADGWSLEMAIPFRTLRYEIGNGHDWGINFARHIRRKNEVVYWAPIPRSFNISRVSMAGTLEGLSIDAESRDIRIKPYVAGRTVRDLGGASAATNQDAGVDVTYGVTRHLTLNLTVNPDFAQVEADEQQVNLSQFSQFFPEKREFFLENSGIFYVGDAARNNRVNLAPTPDEDMLLFFSRRIGLSPTGLALSIPAGIRLSGNAAGLSIGALAMQTNASDLTSANRYGVLRVRRNLRQGSDVGIILLDRESIGTNTGAVGRAWNRVGGVDANFRLPGVWDWNSYGVVTRAPDRSGGQYTWRSSISHEGNFFHGKVGVLEVGDGFTNDLGYFRRTDTRKYLSDIGIRPRPKWLAKIRGREMHPHIVWNYYETLDGTMSAKDLHSGYTLFLNSGAYAEVSYNPRFQRIVAPFRIDSRIAPIPAGGYAWTERQLKGGTDASRALSSTYTLVEGGLWNGTQHTQIVAVTARPNALFSATVGLSHTQAKLTDPDARFEALLWTGRTRYNFTTNMFLDALAQFDPRSQQINANVRFNLIHHPLSDLFVVFNEQKIALPDAPATGYGVIVKYTQMFAF